jgi:hypothetical protein
MSLWRSAAAEIAAKLRSVAAAESIGIDGKQRADPVERTDRLIDTDPATIAAA